MCEDQDSHKKATSEHAARGVTLMALGVGIQMKAPSFWDLLWVLGFALGSQTLNPKLRSKPAGAEERIVLRTPCMI